MAALSESPVFVVIGGGIAGVTCAEELSRLSPEARIILISSSPLIKAVTNVVKVSRNLEQFDISECRGELLTEVCPNVTVHHSTISSWDPASQTISWDGDKQSVKYTKLCICTGGAPNIISTDNPHVIGIRDTESVQDFQQRLGNARRIAVVGNGGIAVELVYEVQGYEVLWAIKDQSIGQTFFDEGAATFFLPHLSDSNESTPDKPHKVKVHKRRKYTAEGGGAQGKGSKERKDVYGGALGPDWNVDLSMYGMDQHKTYPHVHIEYSCTVTDILTPQQLKNSHLVPSDLPRSHQTTSVNPENTRTPDSTVDERSVNAEYTHKAAVNSEWPVYIKLSNLRVYGCDLVVSATGVIPNTAWIRKVAKSKTDDSSLKFAEDGGVIVDSAMRSSLSNVYAAGDVCSVDWRDHSSTWFPMRLWTQARQMGAYAARCMDAHNRNEDVMLDFCFELFAHVTVFFGYKVVLLGRYNAQGLGRDYELLIRCTKGVEYVKVVLQNGRMVGAILIGETDLEETFENLILNQMDLSRFGESLLDPDIDIEDYFD